MFKYSGKVNKVMSAELLNFIKSNFNNKIKNAENYDQKNGSHYLVMIPI